MPNEKMHLRTFIVNSGCDEFLIQIEKKIHECRQEDIRVIKADSSEADMFFLYEYSDDVCVVSCGQQFPNIMNFHETGILTEEEILESLLY